MEEVVFLEVLPQHKFVVLSHSPALEDGPDVFVVLDGSFYGKSELCEVHAHGNLRGRRLTKFLLFKPLEELPRDLPRQPVLHDQDLAHVLRQPGLFNDDGFVAVVRIVKIDDGLT